MYNCALVGCNKNNKICTVHALNNSLPTYVTSPIDFDVFYLFMIYLIELLLKGVIVRSIINCKAHGP
jgi:hypothetical protein